MNKEHHSWFKLGYLVGMLDGEGCIYKLKNDSWGVNITNTNKESIDFLCTIAPFIITTSKTDAGKPVYRAVLNKQKQIYKLLGRLIPFLIIKKDKARECLEELSVKLKKELWLDILES